MDILLTLTILVVAVVFLILALTQKMSMKQTGGVEYLGMYSNLIFIILMTAPLQTSHQQLSDQCREIHGKRDSYTSYRFSRNRKAAYDTENRSTS